MPRPVTLFTGQWADLPLETLAEKAASWGYDGLELACWGDHFDAARGAEDPAYGEGQREILAGHELQLWAISHHLAGQLICDPNDRRSDAWVPDGIKGDAEAKRQWGIDQTKAAATAASHLGLEVVCGFTGSSVWHLIYPFPPASQQQIEEGYRYFAEQFYPILDHFDEHGIKFAYEVHPTEAAFDIYSTHLALEAVDDHPAFGFNFDPSHLHWQGVDPVEFIWEFRDRIFHVHVKDAIVTLDGRSGILSSHLPFGDHRRGWDFRSPGRGDVDFEEIIRALNDIGYDGPLSVEWEDSGMDREHGAAEACQFVRALQFPPAEVGFEEGFDN